MMVSIAVAAIACINVLITVWSGVPGLDGTMWPARVKSDAMAYGTSACFLLAAVCSFSLSRRRALSDQTFVRVATIGLLTASVAFVGYAFDADALYGVFLFTTMAPHTAVAFVLLYTALLLTGRHVGWVGVLTAEGRGSAGARRLLPVAIGGPLLLCLLTNAATRAEWFSANFRLSLLAIMMMVLAAYAVLRNARMENQRSTSSARPWAS